MPLHVVFEEHAGPQRAGGIEAATRGLITALANQDVRVTRRFTDVPKALDAVPDCVHIHGIWSPVLAKRFLHWRRRGIPCVVTVHGMLSPWALAHKHLKKRFAWHIYQNRLLNLASALHATSEREAGDLRNLGLKPRIEVIPWGIEMPGEGLRKVISYQLSVISDCASGPGHDPQATSPSIFDHPSALCPWPSAHRRTALFVGRIYPVKGLPMLVDAWAKVRPSGWKIKIVGPDEAGHRAEVEALVRTAGLEIDFEFAGELTGEALHQAYADAELFILPSYTENFGMVVAEALAHGCPVIASQGGPWRGLLEHACGWWSEISSDALADALQEATSLDPDALRLMGNRGRQWMQQDFSWEHAASRMAKLYRSIA